MRHTPVPVLLCLCLWLLPLNIMSPTVQLCDAQQDEESSWHYQSPSETNVDANSTCEEFLLLCFKHGITESIVQWSTSFFKKFFLTTSSPVTLLSHNDFLFRNRPQRQR